MEQKLKKYLKNWSLEEFNKIMLHSLSPKSLLSKESSFLSTPFRQDLSPLEDSFRTMSREQCLDIIEFVRDFGDKSKDFNANLDTLLDDMKNYLEN